MENQGKVTTVAELVQLTIDELRRVRVPVELIEEIGFPIARAVRALQECQAAWARDEAEAARKAQEGEDDIEISLEPEGEGGAGHED